MALRILALRWHGKAGLRCGRAKHGYDDHNRIGSAKHGQSLDSHRDGIALMRPAPQWHGQGTHRKGVAQSRKAAALLWTAWRGTATAKVREEMRCQGIARLSWRRRTPQRMSIGWLGWGIASGGLESAEHRIALHYTARAKFSEASQRLRTSAHSYGKEQLRPAPRRHDIEPRWQSMDTQSGGMAVNLCARDWQGKAGNRRGIARPRTATAMVGTAPLC